MVSWREVRVRKRLPVHLAGVAPDRTPFEEDAYTVDISRQGARLRHVTELLERGQSLELTYRGESAPYRVVWVGQAGTPLDGQVGLCCLETREPVWGIPLPPPRPVTPEEEQSTGEYPAPVPEDESVAQSPPADEPGAGAPPPENAVVPDTWPGVGIDLEEEPTPAEFTPSPPEAHASPSGAPSALEEPPAGPPPASAAFGEPYRAEENILRGQTMRRREWLPWTVLAIFVVAFILTVVLLRRPSPAPQAGPETPATASPALTDPEPPLPTLEPATPPLEPEPAPAFAVQVGAFESRENAEELAQKLSAAYGKEVLVSPTTIGGKTLHRVQVAVASREEAEQVAVRLTREQGLKSVIAPLP